MISFFKAAGLGVAASVLTVSAYAAIPLYTVTEGITAFVGSATFSIPATITQSFTLTENYNLTALGLLDSGFRAFDYQPYQPPGSTPDDSYKIFNQGFFGSHTVSVLNSTSGVVAQTTFSAGLTGYAGPGSLPLSNLSSNQNLAQFKYIDIAPIALTAGQYTMVSTWDLNGRDGFTLRVANGGYDAAQGATLGNVFVRTGPINGFPAGVGFASNLLLEPAAVSPIPEPSEIAMMVAGLGVVGAIARRRKAREIALNGR
jgi:hypothetical protein